MRPIHLDYNTTTPIAPRVQEAMLPYLAELYASPSGTGPGAEAVWQAIEDARFRVRCALGATDDHRIAFTSGGTESCQTAVRGVLENWRRCDYGPTPHVVVSAVEHGCITDLVKDLANAGLIESTTVGCDDRGVVAPEAVAEVIRRDTALVCVAHADAVTGAIQPVAEIARVCHDAGTLLHVDAAASFGKINVNVEHLGADLLSISGHKTYAPKGVGALYARDTAVLSPVFVGGGADGGHLRAGTPNVPGVVGFGYAAELAVSNLAESAPRLAALRDRFEGLLFDEVGDAFELADFGAERLPNTSFGRLAEFSFLSLVESAPELSLQGLSGLGSNPQLRHGGFWPVDECFRLSVGWYTSEEEIDRAVSLLLDAWERSRG